MSVNMNVMHMIFQMLVRKQKLPCGRDASTAVGRGFQPPAASPFVWAVPLSVTAYDKYA